MRLPLLIAAPVILAISACTPDRSLTTAAPYWPREYRDGYNDGYVATIQRPDYDYGAGYPASEHESDNLNN